MKTINSLLTNREFDENGFLFVKDNLILCDGIMEYYGYEFKNVIPEVQEDKIYKFNISKEELKKCKDKWAMIPIREGHDWTTSENVKGEQIGTIGENIQIKNIDGKNYLLCNLSFYDKKAIDEIVSGEKYELSTSYQNDLVKSNNPEYDFEVIDIVPNHLALVEKGRAGEKVRVANENTISNDSFNNLSTNQKLKMENEIKLVIDDKEVDLSKFLNEEKAEGEHDDSITDTDNACSKNEDKRKVISEVLGILKDKIDEELWRTIAGKLENLGYEPSETSTTDNEDKEGENKEDKKEDKEEKKGEAMKSMNYDKIYSKIYNSVKNQIEKENQAKFKAYNSAKNICGDFDYSAMNELEILNTALSSVGLTAENVAEANAMIKAYNATASKLDNSISYNNGAENNFKLYF